MRKLILAMLFGLWSSCAAAGIYWLPDYLKDNIDTNHRTDTDTGGGDIPLGCEKYSPQCSSPHILGGIEIRVAGDLFCPMECICPDSFRYTTANCSGDKKLAGSACDGKYNDCRALTCEEKGQKTCNGSCIAKSACCTDSDCGSDQKCSSGSCIAQTCEDKGQKTCNGSCIAKSACCTDSDCGTNQKCSSGSCVAKTCEEMGQKTCNGKCIGSTACCVSDDCPSGKKCFDNVCIAQTCEDKGLKTCNGSCIANSECCNCTSSQKCVNGSCVAKTCADAGGPSCPTGQECKNEACVITSCTSNPSICSNTQKCSNGKCVAKTCSDYYYSYVASIPAKNRCTQVAASEVGNLTCYKGCQLYAEILYSDKTTSVNEIAGKTPIGVVVDSSKRLAAALVYEGNQWEAADNAKVISGKTKLKNLSGLADLGSGSTKTSFKGKANTKIIYDSCSNCSAARYAYEYTTAGTRKGDWFLPDTGELWLMYQNKDAINRTLSSLGKKKVFTGYSEYTSYNYASAESSSTNRGNSDKVKIPTAWGLKLDGTFSTISKHLYHRAHPMITY